MVFRGGIRGGLLVFRFRFAFTFAKTLFTAARGDNAAELTHRRAPA
jgi:hypothetical protein